MKEKFIEVYDNLINPKLQHAIEYSCKNNLNWNYCNNVAKSNDNFFPAMGHVFYDLQENGIPNIKIENLPFFLNILYTLSNQLKICVEEIYGGKSFMHLPSPNPGPDEVHVDLTIPHWVCLYYVNDSEGDTILFKDDRKTEIKRISPKKGRILFFNGLIPHCSSRPSSKTRIILNFDFKGRKL